MFQLIVAVISIALVAALAIASIYYGGSAFSSSSLRANVVTLVNAGQQISGAQALYKTDFGAGATSIQQLRDGNGTTTYLSAEPGKSPIVKSTDGVAVNWQVSNTEATIELTDPSADGVVCKEVVRQAGSNAQFGCSGTGFYFKL